jgi:hypothetical protein
MFFHDCPVLKYSVAAFTIVYGQRKVSPGIKTYDPPGGEADTCSSNGSKDENKCADQKSPTILQPPSPTFAQISRSGTLSHHNSASRNMPLPQKKPGEVLRRAPLEARLAAPTPSPGTIPPLPSPCKHIACSSATYHGSIVPVVVVDGHLHHPEPLDHRKLPLAAAPSATGGNNVLRQEQRGPPPEATPSNCGSNVALLRE